jgi:hypothetical protein
MATGHFILLIETDPSLTQKLVTQLLRLGVEAIRVGDLNDALDAVRSREYSISAVLVPSGFDGKSLRKTLKSMRRRESVLPTMAYGKIPDHEQRKALRQAGVFLSLWDGYDEGVLRFQLNRLIAGESLGAVRGSRRAPVHTPLRVMVGEREKLGVLYSISEGGCYIESPRASMEGARLLMSFVLEERSYEIAGVVVFSNVPGNLQRPNLPLGMGVQFRDTPEPIQKSLGEFIHARLESLEV